MRRLSPPVIGTAVILAFLIGLGAHAVFTRALSAIDRREDSGRASTTGVPIAPAPPTNGAPSTIATPPPESPRSTPGAAWATFRTSVLPPGVYGIDDREIDLTGDGIPEHILYFIQRIPLLGREVEKYRFHVYRWDGTTYVLDHEDEGTEDGVEIDAREFLTPADVDHDRIPEAIITKRHDGTGQYRIRYYLKWDGVRVRDFFFPGERELYDRASAFLRDGEFLGAKFANFPTSTVAICGESDSWCTIRQSAPDAIGQVRFTLEFRNGRLEIVQAERVDFPRRRSP